jgi:transposase
VSVSTLSADPRGRSGSRPGPSQRGCQEGSRRSAQPLSKFLLRHGRVFRQGRNWTARFRKWLVEQKFEHAAEKTTFSHYLAAVDYQEASQAGLENEIASIATEPAYAETVAKLSSLRGIAVLSAMVLITEIQDFAPSPGSSPASSGRLHYKLRSRRVREPEQQTSQGHERRILE